MSEDTCLRSPVLVEQEWMDGPVSGITRISGQAWRYQAQYDEAKGAYAACYLLWPITEEALHHEMEQWQIFVRWNCLYEADLTDVTSHPARSGIDTRWSTLQYELASDRGAPPHNARRAHGVMQRIDQRERYAESGPDYQILWSWLD